MSRRASSLNNYTGTAITREIGSKYDNVKLVAENIVDVTSIGDAIESGDLANALNISNMTVAQGAEGSTPTWDGTTLTIPKGDTGAKGDRGDDAPTITGIAKTASSGLTDTYTITLSDTSNYTFEVSNGYTPVKGVDYTDGVDGKSAYEQWLDAGNTGNLGDFLVDIKGDIGPKGPKGDTGDTGAAGTDLTVEQIGYNGDGTFTWQFSDGTSYVTPDLTGPRGDKGEVGDKGDQGISVHHMKGTNTTDMEGDFGTFGELDTYTFYGDDAETMNLGHFIVRNGFATQETGEELGVMFRKTYDTDEDGIVDNAAALGGKDLATIESERDTAIQAALTDLGTNFSVANNAERLALTNLTVGDKVFVADDGDGKWAQYWVISTTDNTGTGSTFEVVMDEDTYLNANTAPQIKSTYESNPDTNAYTDAEKTKLANIEENATTDQTAAEIETLYEGLADTNKYTDSEKTKVSQLSVTQPVDLDTIESDTALNNTHRTSDGSDHTFIDQDVTTTGTPRFNSVQINGGTGDQGLLSWNIDEETIDMVSDGVTIQLGQEIVLNVHNNTGVLIPNGTPLMFTGTLGNSSRILIAPADGSTMEAHKLVGVATVDIPANTDGKATYFGKVRGIDTTGTTNAEVWSDGDILYIDPSNIGKLTNVKPSSSELFMPVAAVVHAHSSGSLMIRVSPDNKNDISEAIIANYYNKTDLDNGQLDNRYYTETEIDALLALQNEASEIAYNSTTSGLTATNVQDAIDEVESSVAGAVNVTGTETLNRYDKILSNLNVIDMLYDVDGNLVTVRYDGDDNATVYYRDVLSYTNTNLTLVEHFYGTSDLVTATASTSLTYDIDNNLQSTSYTE